MIGYLRKRFENFADFYNLKMDFEYKEQTSFWVLSLYGPSKSWGYRRLFPVDELSTCQVPKEEYANMVLDKVLSYLRRYELI